MSDHKTYLTAVVPQLLSQLTTSHEPSFGVMTPQHMVEHLIWATKSSIKDYGPVPAELSEGQRKFMKFVEGGANFKVFPPKKTREELDPPRLADLSAAIEVVPEAISRIYQHDASHIFYNPMMGKFSMEQIEFLIARHFAWHLEKQFGLKVSV